MRTAQSLDNIVMTGHKMKQNRLLNTTMKQGYNSAFHVLHPDLAVDEIIKNWDDISTGKFDTSLTGECLCPIALAPTTAL